MTEAENMHKVASATPSEKSASIAPANGQASSATAEKSKPVPLQVRIPENIAKIIRIAAAVKNMSNSDFVAMCVKELLYKQKSLRIEVTRRADKSNI